MHQSPRVCIIGAGCSGLVSAKALLDRGLAFDCYEISDRVGGHWVFKNKNGRSGAYRSLHINTSRQRMQFRDFPMPDWYPDYPRHTLIADYFQAYADHFGLSPLIQFGTEVTSVKRHPQGHFEVTLSTGVVRSYSAVVVANGHHWDPLFPTNPSPRGFSGMTLHSHAYIDPSEPLDLRGKRVVVVGMGNSAMDIACELGRPTVAQRVYLSARRGAYVLPKYLLGKPIDQLGGLPRFIPRGVRQRISEFTLERLVGKMQDYGLPKPDHRFGATHPTLSSDLLTMLGSGDIHPKPRISEFRGQQVVFADGSQETIDAIVYCTGYRLSFPFFDPDFIAAPNNELPLFFRVFEPDIPNLFFIGLCQPLGAIMPLAEEQAKWVAEYLAGEYALPSLTSMRERIRSDMTAMKARYVSSPRHTMQVDFDEYLRELALERKRGRARKRRSRLQHFASRFARP